MKSSRFRSTENSKVDHQLINRKTRIPELRRRLRDRSIFGGMLGPIETDGFTISQMSSLLDKIDSLHHAGFPKLVIKSPFGFSGSGQCRISQSQPLSEVQYGWVARQLARYGEVLLGPWLDNVLDGSVVWNDSHAAPQVTFFITDSKGRYRGHRLGPTAGKIPLPYRRQLLDRRNPEGSFIDRILKTGLEVQKDLNQHAYEGPAGMDFYVYRDTNDAILIQAIGEVNCRTTMGHIATALERTRFSTQSHIWLTVTLSELLPIGFSSIRSFANYLKRLVEGEDEILFTNDPDKALGALSFMLRGREAISQLNRDINLNLFGETHE